jgi:DnaJ-class molecular chaperone
VSDPDLEAVMDEMPAPKQDCPECVGTGNFYSNDEDGDFLPCDACDGTGFKK